MDIYVLGEHWRIYFVPPWSKTLTMNNGQQTLGSCDGYSKCIYISSYLIGDKLKEVIQHELCHCLFFVTHTSFPCDEETMAMLIGEYSDDISNLCDEIIHIKYRG